jgi:hypothetical protein
MVLSPGDVPAVVRQVGVFLLLSLSELPCAAKLIPRRDPLDAALESTVIVIMKQQSQDAFQIEEVFLGDLAKGQTLLLPGFKLAVEDTSSVVSGRERIEPIQSGTRILVFLKPASAVPANWQLLGQWAVAGFGNCYFWSHDPGNLDSLREKAKQALTLRTSWEAARNLPDRKQRAEALWPYLWNDNRSCYRQTEAALQEIGTVAGDYIAGRLESMSYQQKDLVLNNFAAFGSVRLHVELIDELKRQQTAWEVLLRRRRTFATYDEVDPPGRMRYYPRRTEDAEPEEASDIYGVLYQGFTGLAGFRDRNDLPFIREAALWGLKYRFKQLDDAALGAFAEMPAKDNLAVIEAIWNGYSTKPVVGNELYHFEIIQTLVTHKFPETIPLMAQFVNSGFMQEMARQFLVQITGVDL